MEYFDICSAIFHNIDIRDAGWILRFGEYYLLQEPLQMYCEKLLENGINSKNWFDAFMLGIELDNEDLQNVARKMMPSRVEHQEMLLEMLKKLAQG